TDRLVIFVPLDLHAAPGGDQGENAGAAIEADPVPESGLLIEPGQRKNIVVARILAVMGTIGGTAAETECRDETRGARQLEVPHLQINRNRKLKLTCCRYPNLAVVHTSRRRWRNIHIHPDWLISSCN